MTLILLSLLAFQPPAFEVASLKPTVHRARAVGAVRTSRGGRVTIEGSPLEHLVEVALDVQRFQVTRGPEWMYIDGFDIEATPPAESRSSLSTLSSDTLNEEQRQMLLALLAERFQLTFHRETRNGPVYFLTRTTKKLKLQETQNKDALPSISGPETGISASNASMPFFARRLSRWLDRSVIDHTRLDGAYDFSFEYDSFDPNLDLIGAILDSIRGLGLKLEHGHGPVETIVIDRAERPSGN